MNFEPTKKQQHLIDLASRLGCEKFAPRAARYDTEASFPFENYDDLQDSGLLGLCIPEEFGGLGADFQTYCLVAAELGRYCGATALTYNMHCCTMMLAGELADDLPMTNEQRKRHEERRAMHFERVIKDGAIYAQPFSEPNSAAAGGQVLSGTTARQVDGGWLINGCKHFASLAGAASFYGLLCTEDKPGERPDPHDTLYLAVSEDTEGFQVTGRWDPLGMRGTVSRSLIMKDVLVPEDSQLLPRGVYYKAASAWPHMFITLSPTYMGIAQAAYDFTVSYLRGEAEGAPHSAQRGSHTKQIFVAEMRIKLEQTQALFLRAISEAKVNPGKDERLRAYAVQYTIMESANDICRLAIRTCGGISMLKPLPLERLYRDSRCGSLMLPWSAEICLERLGHEALYEPGEKN